jgi:hypothetical protein
MAADAKRDQILGAFMPEAAPWLLMMDLQIASRTKTLKTSTIPLHNHHTTERWMITFVQTQI